MIDFSCPRCGTPYHADDSHLGKRIRCGQNECGDIITIVRAKRGHTTADQRQQKDQQSQKSVPKKPKTIYFMIDRPNWNIATSLLCVVLLLAAGLVLWHKRSSKQGEKAAVSQAHLSAISLPTGRRLVADQATSGTGVLVANNGTGLDACVIVIDRNTGHKVREVAVKARDVLSLDHFTPGEYRIVFATGIDWEISAERFNREASYFEFGEIISFNETAGSQETYTITLHHVPNGNVQAKEISETEFHALANKK